MQTRTCCFQVFFFFFYHRSRVGTSEKISSIVKVPGNKGRKDRSKLRQSCSVQNNLRPQA